jgi:molybdate transport system substrate-binding protein
MVLLLVQTGFAAGQEILVAAASSVREPLEQAIERFQSRAGTNVQVSYGSSGRLTHQILRGAPYDLFLSADEVYPQRIEEAGKLVLGPRIYTVGILDLYDIAGGGCGAGNNLNLLAKGLETRSIRRIAIANPDLAPYGRAAREALENTGVWSLVQSHLVFAANVAQAAHYSLKGAVDCAFIARSQAISPHFLHKGVRSEVSRSLYAPLNHAMVLLDGGDDARSLYAYLSGEEVAGIFENAGFAQPENR